MGDSFELTFDFPIPDADWDKIMDVEFENTKSISFRTKSGKTVEFAKVSEEFEWCHDCKEYDKKKHCCPRWTKVIRKTVEELKRERPKGKWKRRLVDSGFSADWYCSECGWKTALEEHGYNFCPHCGARMEE